MSLENARKQIEKHNLQDNIVVHKNDIPTVAIAAREIGCKEGQIGKSLTYKVNDKAVLVVLAGDKKVSNKKFKDVFGVKAKMLKPVEVVDMVGHKVGGVCPFGVKEGVNIYLDESLKKHEVIYPSCGSEESSIKLTIPQLEEVSNYLKWIDISE